MMTTDLLAQAAEFFEIKVRPRANEMDRDPEALRRALEGMIEAGLMCLRRPEEFGGPAADEPTFRAFQELIAMESGALAFLQTQHQSAVSLIAKGENPALKERMLRGADRMDGLIGIGFSQLRRPGVPLLSAARVDGGYVLNGFLPWATGFGFFPHLLIAAQLPDGEAVFGIVPFSTAPGIAYSDPMELCAMQSAQTVTAMLEGYFLPDDMVSTIRPAQWIHKNDHINVTLQGFFAIGCARAALRLMLETPQGRRTEAVVRAHDALLAKVDDCRANLITAQAFGEETTDERLRLRATAIELSARCAHAAVVCHGGSSNSSQHAAQRVYREALVFTVTAQTPAIMEATLAQIVERG